MGRHQNFHASPFRRQVFRRTLSLSSIALSGLLGYGLTQLLNGGAPQPASIAAMPAPATVALVAESAIPSAAAPAPASLAGMLLLPPRSAPAPIVAVARDGLSTTPASFAPPAPTPPSLAEMHAVARPVVARLTPPPVKPAQTAGRVERVVEVERGDTLLSLFQEAGLDDEGARAAVDALRPVFRPKDLRKGQILHLVYEPLRPGYAARLTAIRVDAGAQEIHLTRDAADTFTAKPVDKPLTKTVAHARSSIRANLFQTGKRSGVPLSVMTDVIQAFSYDVDFQRELHPGDQFEVLYERFDDDGGAAVKYGDMLFASLTLGGRALAVYRYTTADGQTMLFDRSGESIRKALLRTPIDGAQLTSGFGMRKHPILGYSKMHKGLDFGASSGTPIFAAGAGTIVEMGPNGAYGNYVRIKHNAQYQTAYAHASRFAKGLKVGKKVKQGDVIAYVGTTGRSTGPHLHYEVMVDGKQVDPLSIKLVGQKLQGQELKRFQALVAAIDKLRNGGGTDRVLIAERP